MTVYINTIKSVLRRRSEAHILEELGERLRPFWAHTNTSATVMGKLLVRGVRASRFRMTPSAVLLSSALAMARSNVSNSLHGFQLAASATSGLTACEGGTVNWFFGSAVAAAKPQSGLAAAESIKSEDSQSTKASAGFKVEPFHNAHYTRKGRHGC